MVSNLVSKLETMALEWTEKVARDARDVASKTPKGTRNGARINKEVARKTTNKMYRFLD
jgi:hypothetical protein